MSSPGFAEIPLPGRRATIRLWHEDGLAGIVRRRGRAGFDAIVTSPPYNLRQPYASYRDDMPREAYLAWIGELGAAADRALSAGGSFFLNVGSPPRDPWLAWDVARRIGERFVLQNVLHWIKSIAIDRRHAGRASGVARDLALGHYRPVGSTRYVHGAHEYVFHFSRTGTVPIDRLAIGVAYQDRSNARRWRDGRRGLRCRGNTWFLPYATIQSGARDRPHPATFPPTLAEWCLRLHGVARIHRWADPFVGIGSSAVAAVRAGRTFEGFDIDRGYLAEARRRVREALRAERAGSSGAGPARSRAAAGSTRGSAAS